MSMASGISKTTSFLNRKAALKEIVENEAAPENLENIEVVDPTIEKAPAEIKEESEPAKEDEGDQVEEIEIDLDEKLTSVSQQKTSTEVSGQTGATGMSGRTYISLLKKQLDTEKEARENLEKELSELKHISSEIASQLSEMQKTE